MSRLVKLYPRAWRRRYEDEFLALLEEVGPSRRLAVDLVLGAIRAHLRSLGPRLVTAAGVARASFSSPDGPSPAAARLAVISLVLVLPTLVFLSLAAMKYGMGIHEPFDSVEPLFLHIEYPIVLAPWVAFALAVRPILRIDVRREDGALMTTFTLHPRAVNVVAAVLSGVVIGALLLYFLVENF